MYKVKIYKDKYNKEDFYSVMGKYFAERRYRKELPYIINDDRMEWYLVYNDSKLVGFSSTLVDKNKILFGNMYVLEEYREKGVWSFMADYLIEQYKDNTIQVTTNIDRLIVAWKERGFSNVGNRGSYIILRRDRVEENSISSTKC